MAADEITLSKGEAELVHDALLDASCTMPQIHPDRGRVMAAFGVIHAKMCEGGLITPEVDDAER